MNHNELVARLRNHDHMAWQDDLDAAADAIESLQAEVERLMAKVEVAEAGYEAAVRKAQWQASTNAELNRLIRQRNDLGIENERLRGDLAVAKVERQMADAECVRLREELAAAQKDAAMFLWLADAEPFSARWQIVRLEWWRGRDGWSDVRGEALRSAIGAAMAQEKRDE